jgi:Putative beta-barrel porin 2
MKLKLSRRIIFTGKTKRTRQLMLVTFAGLCALSAKAQQVVAPPPSVSVTPPAMAAEAPGEMQVFSAENPVTTFLSEVQPLQWGPVTLRPHVFYQFTYGTDILSSTNQHNDTVIQSFAPGVLFVLSPRWTLDYTPTFTFYSDKNFNNTVGQSVTLTGGATYNEWVFGLSQNFNYSSAPEVQTGAQTSQSTYATGLTASCPLNSKMSVDLALSQDLSFPSGFQRSLQWSTMDWLNYEFWPRLVVGVGAGVGYIDATPNTLFEQLQGRVNWRATDKLSFSLNGGAQISQFTDGGAAPLVNPLFGASIQYQPFEHTQISLNGSETVNTSYFQNQVNVTTTVGAGLSQRLLEKFYLGVNGSYNWNNYDSAATGVAANSSQDYYSVGASLSTTIFRRVSASVFYSYSDNSTSQNGLAFSSHQIGFNVGYQY